MSIAIFSWQIKHSMEGLSWKSKVLLTSTPSILPLCSRQEVLDGYLHQPNNFLEMIQWLEYLAGVVARTPGTGWQDPWFSGEYRVLATCGSPVTSQYADINVIKWNLSKVNNKPMRCQWVLLSVKWKVFMWLGYSKVKEFNQWWSGVKCNQVWGSWYAECNAKCVSLCKMW